MALQDMFDALVARGPASLVAAHAGDFAKLIGSWKVEIHDDEGDGAKRVSEGEWHFGWALEGRAIQDVLIVPSRMNRGAAAHAKGNRYLTSLRVFDSLAHVWRVFTIDPVTNIYLALTARQEDGRVVQEGADVAGNDIRVSLFDFVSNAFRMREERADGEGWKTITELSAVRIG
jgi:hypothetical protein